MSTRRAGPLTFMQLDLNGEADDRQSGREPYSIPPNCFQCVVYGKITGKSR